MVAGYAGLANAPWKRKEGRKGGANRIQHSTLLFTDARSHGDEEATLCSDHCTLLSLNSEGPGHPWWHSG